MINVLGLSEENKVVIKESYEKLSQKYHCTLENDLVEAYNNKLSSTRLLEDYSTIGIKNVFKIQLEKDVFYILSIYLANYSEKIAPRVLIFGLSYPKTETGNLFIRPETLLDKIGDIFNRKDIDFEEHKGFSNKYCLFADDKALVKQTLSKEFLNEVYKLDKIHIEVYNKMLLATFNKKITTEDTMALAGFMEKMKGMGY
jgi:hypothetical protein